MIKLSKDFCNVLQKHFGIDFTSNQQDIVHVIDQFNSIDLCIEIKGLDNIYISHLDSSINGLDEPTRSKIFYRVMCMHMIRHGVDVNAINDFKEYISLKDLILCLKDRDDFVYENGYGQGGSDIIKELQEQGILDILDNTEVEFEGNDEGEGEEPLVGVMKKDKNTLH